MNSKGSKRILFLVNDLPFFVSHRFPIALAALNAGYDVYVAGPASNEVDVRALGLKFHPIYLSRISKSIICEARTFVSIFKAIWKIKPALVHAITIKPVLYGSIACRLLKVSALVVAVSGLGSVFISEGIVAGFLRSLVVRAYRLALKHSNEAVLFQNPDDKRQFMDLKLVANENAYLIRGSGINLKDYPYVSEPGDTPIVVMASRLLFDKGIREFVEASQILEKRNVQVRFKVFGSIDRGNPASISEQQLKRWKDQGPVEFCGFSSDVAGEYARANIVCLPSYREGLPKALIEAAACGRAVITTDVPGCRYAVEPGVTGVLVPVRDAAAIAAAVEFLVSNPSERLKMGAEGRKLALSEFSIDKVICFHLNLYGVLLGRS